MRASWSALHASLTRKLNRACSETRYREMRQTQSDLASHASVAALMEYLHTRGSDAAARFRIIRTLVVAAQSDRCFRETAQIMVILALWPGLDAVFWRLTRGFPDDRDSLSSEILARLSEAILVLDLQKVTAVAATLLRNLERDIRRDLIGARVVRRASLPINEEAVEAEADATTDAGLAGDHNMDAWVAGLNAEDAKLLRRVFVLGETQEEAGRALGLSPAAARKRYQRALAKTRAHQKICSALSHSDAAVGL